MAELDFERRLERLFAETPAMPDAEAFAQRVEQRLNRGWTARRLLIGAAGGVGGVIGASQLVMSNLMQRVEAASEGSARLASADWGRLVSRIDWLSALPSDSVVWIAAAAAVVLAGFALTRVIEEI